MRARGTVHSCFKRASALLSPPAVSRFDARQGALRRPRVVPVSRGTVPVPLEALPSLLSRPDFGGLVPAAAAFASAAASFCFATGCVYSPFLTRNVVAARGAAHGAAARHDRLCRSPSAAPTGRCTGPLQPKGHLPQRDHGRGLVLSDAGGAQSRGGRPRRARGAGILPTVAPRSLRAQATRKPITRTSSSTRTTRTAWCTASSVSRSPSFNLCLRSPDAV